MSYSNLKNIIIKLISKYLGGFISIIWLIFGVLTLMEDAYALSFFMILSLILSFSFFRNIFKPYKWTILIEFTVALYYSCKNISFFWFMYPYIIKNIDSAHNNPSFYISKEILYAVAPYIQKNFSDKVSIFFDATIKHPFPMIIFYFLIISFYMIRFFSIKILNPDVNLLSK